MTHKRRINTKIVEIAHHSGSNCPVYENTNCIFIKI